MATGITIGRRAGGEQAEALVSQGGVNGRAEGAAGSEHQGAGLVAFRHGRDAACSRS